MKKLLVILIVLLLRCNVFAFNPLIVCSGAVSASTCASSSIDSGTLVETDNGGMGVYGANLTRGDDFVLSSTGNLDYFEFKFTGTPVAPTLRYGTGTDLTSSYYEEIALVDQGSGWWRATSSTNQELTGSTTYYWGINDASASESYIRYYNIGSGGGSIYGNATPFLLTTGSDTSRELLIRIAICD